METSERQMMCEMFVFWILTSNFQLCGSVRMIFSVREKKLIKYCKNSAELLSGAYRVIDCIVKSH